MNCNSLLEDSLRLKKLILSEIEKNKTRVNNNNPHSSSNAVKRLQNMLEIINQEILERKTLMENGRLLGKKKIFRTFYSSPAKKTDLELKILNNQREFDMIKYKIPGFLHDREFSANGFSLNKEDLSSAAPLDSKEQNTRIEEMFRNNDLITESGKLRGCNDKNSITNLTIVSKFDKLDSIKSKNEYLKPIKGKVDLNGIDTKEAENTNLTKDKSNSFLQKELLRSVFEQDAFDATTKKASNDEYLELRELQENNNFDLHSVLSSPRNLISKKDLTRKRNHYSSNQDFSTTFFNTFRNNSFETLSYSSNSDNDMLLRSKKQIKVNNEVSKGNNGIISSFKTTKAPYNSSISENLFGNLCQPNFDFQPQKPNLLEGNNLFNGLTCNSLLNENDTGSMEKSIDKETELLYAVCNFDQEKIDFLD